MFKKVSHQVHFLINHARLDIQQNTLLIWSNFIKDDLLHHIKFFPVVETGKKNYFPCTVNNYISCNTCFLQCNQSENICTGIERKRIVTLISFLNLITFSTGSSRSMPITLSPVSFFGSQISFSIKGISVRQTLHQLAVN